MSRRHVLCVRPGALRVNYFDGRLLSAADFRAEQEYLLGKLHQLTRVVLGAGIVNGLRVSAGAHGLSVSPGVAVDPLGRLIELTEPCSFKLPRSRGPWDLYIELVEVPCNAVPVIAEPPSTNEATHDFAMLQDTVSLWLEVRPAGGRRTPAPRALRLAGITPVKGGVPRIRRA